MIEAEHSAEAKRLLAEVDRKCSTHLGGEGPRGVLLVLLAQAQTHAMVAILEALTAVLGAGERVDEADEPRLSDLQSAQTGSRARASARRNQLGEVKVSRASQEIGKDLS